MTMNSLIIVSKNRQSIDKYLDDFLISKKIENVDRDLNTFEKAVGIPDIRALQQKLYFKPLKSKDKAVIIDAPAGLTTEAQNSLLKILEEPPENTFILLVVSTKNTLLPTVISRCKIVELKEDAREKDFSESYKILDTLSSTGIGEKLKIAQDFSKTKDEAVIFLENLILASREKLLENPADGKMLKTLKGFQKTHAIIKSTNAAPRLTLENLFLSL